MGRTTGQLETGVEILIKYAAQNDFYAGNRGGMETIEVAVDRRRIPQHDFTALVTIGWRFDDRWGFFYTPAGRPDEVLQSVFHRLTSGAEAHGIR